MRLADYLSRESEPLRSELERFFANFPADAPVSPLTLPAGKFLIRQDDPCGAVYILLEGQTTTLASQPGYNTYAFWDFEAIELFGEYEVLSEMTSYLAEVKAKTRCRFLMISAQTYMDWMMRDGRMFLSRVRSVLQTLVRQTAQERRSLFLDGTARMMQFLARYYEKNAKKGAAVTVAMTRPAISEEIGFCTRTVNRSLHRLAEEGVVTIQHGKVRMTAKQYEMLSTELEHRTLR